MAHSKEDRYAHKRGKEHHQQRLERKRKAKLKRQFLRQQREMKTSWGECHA